ncbi:MAG: MATE family efflux transporter [Clostridia bacterium]|nr:MATE family efflux transporter [Clostridia bacterium]
MTKSRIKINKKTVLTILALAGPTMLEQLLHTLVQYIDTAMVGSLGTEATASVGSTTTVSWLFGSTISAIGVGFLAFISQAIGAKKYDSVKKASAQSVLAVLFFGIIFTIIPLALSPFIPIWMQVDPKIQKTASIYFFIIYMPMLFRTASIIFGTVLRAVGDTKTPMKAGILVNIINVVLNLIFIYPTRIITLPNFYLVIPGFNLGVIGAGIASAIAFLVGGVVIFISLWRHPIVSPKGQSLRPDFKILKPCFKVALPNALQRFGTSFGYVAFASMVNSLGEISTAAHTVANTVESAFYIPGYGMQSAASTLSGNAYGAKDKDRLNEISRTILVIEVLLMVASGGLLLLLAPNMMSIFSKDAGVIALGSVVLRMVAVSEPFYGASIVIEGMMHGLGKTTMPFVTNIIGMWLIRILGTFIATQIFDFGLIGAWACMILHNLMLFVMFFIYYVSGKYNPMPDGNRTNLV